MYGFLVLHLVSERFLEHFGVLGKRYTQLYITIIALGMLWMFLAPHHLDKLVSYFFGYGRGVVLEDRKCGGTLIL